MKERNHSNVKCVTNVFQSNVIKTATLNQFMKKRDRSNVESVTIAALKKHT